MLLYVELSHQALLGGFQIYQMAETFFYTAVFLRAFMSDPGNDGYGISLHTRRIM